MEKQTTRLEAFSDGIFGVAITLLAIEIGIGEYEGANNANLWHKITEKWPEYFSYFNSFATVLLIWMGHQKIIKKIHKTNHRVLLVNGLVLLLVVLFPFPTRTVGNFIGTDAVNTAVSFYAGFTGLIVLSMLLLNLSIIRSPHLLIDEAKHLPWFKNQTRQQLIAVAVYAGAAGMAFYSPSVALGMTFMMWVFWAVITQEEDEA